MLRRSLILTIESILIIIFLYFMVFVGLQYISIPCFFHSITDLYCPGCGMTRAITRLLKFDFLGAIRNNLLLVLLIPFFLYYLFRFVKEYVINAKRISLTMVYPNSVLYMMIFLCLLFSIVRNLSIFWFLQPIL